VMLAQELAAHHMVTLGATFHATATN